MAKKNDNTTEKSDARKGLSQGAWVAIDTIAAALITGTVAVLTHVLPKASSSPAQTLGSSMRTDSSMPTPVPSSRPVATTAEAMAGKQGREVEPISRNSRYGAAIRVVR